MSSLLGSCHAGPGLFSPQMKQIQLQLSRELCPLAFWSKFVLWPNGL
jgi:hypothetical protein